MRGSVSDYIPQCGATGDELPVRGAGGWLAWGVVGLCASVFVGLILFAPLASAWRVGGWSGAVVYGAFGFVCHQMPERSFHIAGHALAVCARCFGIYAGFALGVLVYPLVRSVHRTDAPARAWLLAATLPLAVDFMLGLLGLWDNTHLSRFTTGALVGAAAVFYVMPGASELCRRDRRRRRRIIASDSSERAT